MPKKQTIEEIDVTAAGGSITLDVSDYVDIYKIAADSGAVTLTTNLTIAETGTPEYGMEYLFYYAGDITQDGNTFTFMGETFPEDLEASKCWIRAFYTIDSTWEVVLMPDFVGQPIIAEDMINDDAITNDKVADDAVDSDQIVDDAINSNKLATDAIKEENLTDGIVTADKLAGTLDQQIIVFPVSFNTGEVGVSYDVPIPWNATLTSLYWDVTTDIESTDDGTLSITVGGGSTTPASITILAGLFQGQSGTTAFSFGDLTAGDQVGITPTKTTAGGKLLVTLTFTITD